LLNYLFNFIIKFKWNINLIVLFLGS